MVTRSAARHHLCNCRSCYMNLRRKIEREHLAVVDMLTVYGIGYKLNDEVGL